MNSGINFVIKNAEETLQSEDTHYSDNLDLKEDDEFSDELSNTVRQILV